MTCVGCGKDLPEKFHDVRFCGICQITGSRQMALVGLEYATKGRVDMVNPYKDTMRAIEYIAKTEPKWSRAHIERWKQQAALLPDKSTKIPDGEWDHSTPAPSGAIMKQEAEDAGRVRELWNKAVYEREVLKQKPVNEIQAANYAMVDRWNGSGA